MAETAPKRQREETHGFPEENADPKRQKSYDQILSLLEEEQEQEPNQDFSSILKTLQRELDDDPFSVPGSETDPNGNNPTWMGGEEKDEAERFMRHLLEASDDELGIPHRVDGGDGEGMKGEDEISFCDGLWDLEDEAANYYSLMQSELYVDFWE
ncbi:uncharacterized protein LOC131310432 [Rhododendron vialii]|uniref:uncharacterized protein LOC131310432 n=1 Tax=Rhododendron vialii TaxID=182163 RepID=UPI00265DE662|nr:uncharacterized protein LOC131310432 [Rhododendron vialii]